MKHRLQHITIFATLLLCINLDTSANASIEAYSSPAAAPHFSLADLVDQNHTLADYRGKVVLINFWASWCPPCIHEMPSLTKLQQQLPSDAFEIIAINVGEKKYKVKKFTRLINFNLPVLLDTASNTYDQWGVRTLPTSFILDKGGALQYKIQGNPGWNSKEILTIIQSLISQTAGTTNKQQ